MRTTHSLSTEDLECLNVKTDDEGRSYMIRHVFGLEVEVFTTEENEEGELSLKEATLRFNLKGFNRGTFSDGSSREYIIRAIQKDNIDFLYKTNRLEKAEDGTYRMGQLTQLYTLGSTFDDPDCFESWFTRESLYQAQFLCRPGGPGDKAGHQLPSDEELKMWVPVPKRWFYEQVEYTLPSE